MAGAGIGRDKELLNNKGVEIPDGRCGYGFPTVILEFLRDILPKNIVGEIREDAQNGQSFREKTGAFRKIVKKHANLVFVTAPNVVPPLEPETGEKEADTGTDQRGWWFSREDDYFKAQDVTDCQKGYHESLQIVQEAFQQQGPFDGVLGFSQGASFLSLLCALQDTKADSLFKFDFAIIVAGFKSRSRGHNVLYSSKISCPTLHVFGDTDNVIPKELSEELVQDCFTQANVLQHPGGHFIPASGPQKKVYIDFLNQMLERKKSRS